MSLFVLAGDDGFSDRFLKSAILQKVKENIPVIVLSDVLDRGHTIERPPEYIILGTGDDLCCIEAYSKKSSRDNPSAQVIPGNLVDSNASEMHTPDISAIYLDRSSKDPLNHGQLLGWLDNYDVAIVWNVSLSFLMTKTTGAIQEKILNRSVLAKHDIWNDYLVTDDSSSQVQNLETLLRPNSSVNLILAFAGYSCIRRMPPSGYSKIQQLLTGPAPSFNGFKAGSTNLELVAKKNANAPTVAWVAITADNVYTLKIPHSWRNNIDNIVAQFI